MDCPLYEEVTEQPEIQIIQPAPAPAPAVIQTEVQPAVTVVQPGPVPVVTQPVQQHVTVVSKPNLTDLPGKVRCTYCQVDVITVIRYLTDTTVACNLFGSHCSFSIWPCCLIPCHSCHDVEHSCPNCTKVLYVFKRQ